MLPRYPFEKRERARSAQSEAAHAHNPHWRISPRRERRELGDVGHMALYLDVVREAESFFLSQFFSARGAGQVGSEGVAPRAPFRAAHGPSAFAVGRPRGVEKKNKRNRTGAQGGGGRVRAVSPRRGRTSGMTVQAITIS